MVDKKTILDGISLLCLFFAAVFSLDDAMNTYALYGALPIAMLCCFVSNNPIKNNRYIKLLIFLYIWVAVCYPFAYYPDLANREMKQILGCFILCFTVASLASKPVNITPLYLVYCLLLLFAWNYAHDNIMKDAILGTDRLNDENLNANTLAYYTFFVTISIYALGEYAPQKLRFIFRILFWATIVLSFITAIYTASRQVLLIQVPLYVCLIFHRYFIGNRTHRFFPILIVVVSCLFLYSLYTDYGETIFNDSLLKKRSEIEFKDDVRYTIIKESLELFKSEPALGYGPGNSSQFISTGHFTHNTFLELMVNCGLVGFLIYLYMVLSFIWTQYKRWRKAKDKSYLFFAIFGVFWFVDQFFYVFYTHLWLISFFILVATHSEVYYSRSYKRELL
ncbi:MAG: O-antigen ligase family protein [Bacteroidaceae bacterium]|nr:O-antigen ligase family protein [Bacteroidaceae bacterium]